MLILWLRDTSHTLLCISPEAASNAPATRFSQAGLSAVDLAVDEGNLDLALDLLQKAAESPELCVPSSLDVSERILDLFLCTLGIRHTSIHLVVWCFLVVAVPTVDQGSEELSGTEYWLRPLGLDSDKWCACAKSPPLILCHLLSRGCHFVLVPDQKGARPTGTC